MAKPRQPCRDRGQKWAHSWGHSSPRADYDGRVSRALAVAVLLACGSPPPARPPANRPAGPSLEQAKAAERGAGVPRDYERAARIYDQLCDRGRGQIEACLDLIDAMVDARGVASDLAGVRELDRVLCRRGTALACLEGAMFDVMAQRSDQAAPPDALAAIERATKEVAAACERGDGRACEVSVMGGDSGTAEWDRRTKYSVACQAGRMEACGRVAIDLEMCGEPEVDDPAACEQRTVAAWRAHDYDRDLAADAQKLYDECRAGNALACQHIPTQRIPMAARCAAHDYGACAELGCLGDDAARALALAHGADQPNCFVAGKDALLAWKLRPGQTRFEPLVTDGQRPGGARPTPPWEAVRFQHHGGRDRADWPRFDVYNMNDHALAELSVCLYAYDTAGNQLAWFAGTPRLAVAPNALVPLALDVPDEPRLPDATAEVVIDYSHVRFDGGAATDDAARCPAHRPRGQAGAYTHW